MDEKKNVYMCALMHYNRGICRRKAEEQEASHRDFNKAIFVLKLAQLPVPLDFFVCRALSFPSNFKQMKKWSDFQYCLLRSVMAPHTFGKAETGHRV